MIFHRQENRKQDTAFQDFRADYFLTAYQPPADRLPADTPVPIKVSRTTAHDSLSLSMELAVFS